MRDFYVGVSTLLITLAISAISVVGFNRFLSGQYSQILDLAWKVGLGVFVCVNLAYIFSYIFSTEYSLVEVIKVWIDESISGLRKHWRRIIVFGFTIFIGVCFIAGTVTLVGEVYKNFMIARDAEKFVLGKIAPLQEKLASVESDLRIKTLRIADLETKVKVLSEENVKLRETVKKASRF